jgi:predicted thioesterase
VPFEQGSCAEVHLTVSDADTAQSMHSGEVAVLATPRLVALAEEASVAAIAGQVPAGHTTVGMRVQFDHLRPNKVGTLVSAEATLEKVEGRRLTFTVSVNDECGLVGAGKVTRVVVEVERFLDNAR